MRLENSLSSVTVAGDIEFDRAGFDTGNMLIVTDENLAALPEVAAFIDEARCPSVVLPPGEAHKSLSSIETIAETALRGGLDRQASFIGIGGGVICDMTAFAASVYMRGCNLVLYPTTLLSMVDASIGGKTGVDFLGRKNMLGSFYPADQVRVCCGFLSTLSESEFRSGLAEVIKHAFLSGADFLDFIETNRAGIAGRDGAVLEELVARSLRIKARYIEEDFREKGVRAHLNFGHTFGHALEAAAGLGRFTHGEAVAWGMARALEAGVLMGITDEAYAKRARAVLEGFGYDLDYNDFDGGTFRDAISSDKKKADGEVRFILQKNIGDTFISPIETAILEEVIS